MQCTRVTIDRLWRRFQQNGNVADRSRTSRPKNTTPQGRYSRLQHARERYRPATVTARTTVGPHNCPVSSRTVRRRLAFAARHRRARLNWATARQGRSNRSWNTVLFSDERKVNLVQAYGRQRIYCRRKERLPQCCVRKTNLWGGGWVMVWVGISARDKTPLHVVGDG